MTTATTTLEAYKNNDKSYTLTFKDVNGNAYSLASCTVYFTVRQNVSDTGDTYVFQKTITNGDATGIVTLTVDAADLNIAAGVYHYNVTLLNSSQKRTTMGAGIFIIKERVEEHV